MVPRSRTLLGVLLGIAIGFVAGLLAVAVQAARDAAEASVEQCHLHHEIANLQEQVELLQKQLDNRKNTGSN